MLSLTFIPIAKATIGHKDENSPFVISNNGMYRAKMGFEAKTSSGVTTALLSIHRRGTNTDTNTKASKNSGPNLDDYSDENRKGIQQTDKPLLESFISHLGIQGAASLDNLKSKLSKVDASQNLKNFISYVRNGAFFKHWADHYAEQAKIMASSLQLAP